MKWQTLTYPVFLGVLILLLPACGGGGGGYVPPSQATAPAQPPPPASAPGYQIGPGMQRNFGMMRDNMGQMYGMMGQGGMSPENHNQMMGMMGQMGGMMQGMGGPYYNEETEQRQRRQLEEMQQNLNNMQRQARAGGASSGSEIFASNCASCHPNGGNAINPNMPVAGAPELGSYYSFRSLVRGGRGAMPAFSSGRISDSQLRALFGYVSSAYGG
jgi:mono/diheme cytochrome c family protein